VGVEQSTVEGMEMTANTCRFCATTLAATLVDLGMQPLANSYVDPARGEQPETFYPLHVRVCANCLLVQLPELATAAQIFTEYAYLSGISSTWIEHCDRFAEAMVDRLALASTDIVIELASNDGTQLSCFRKRGVPVLGIDPAANIAEIARRAGVDTIAHFFSADLAEELARAGRAPRLIVANNVLAHVPDINSFVQGIRILLAPNGIASLEFPHLVQLMSGNQFDTIYHEHFSYLSLLAVHRIMAHHGLRVFDVDELATHGGSLRIYACHATDAEFVTTERVSRVLNAERAFGLTRMATYERFGEQVRETKRALLELLVREKRANKRIVGYGAPAKGNTLLNYCGIRDDFVDFTVDRNPLKQGKLLPGTHVRIEHTDAIRAARPDFILILPWNIEHEIVEQLAYVREWGGRFIVPIPKVRVV
jgi:SAM-dependent methyltransferase